MPLPYCTHPIVVSHYSYCERLLSHLKKSIHCLQLQIISQRLQTGRRPIRVLCECGTSLKCEPRSAQRIASPRFGERAANIRLRRFSTSIPRRPHLLALSLVCCTSPVRSHHCSSSLVPRRDVCQVSVPPPNRVNADPQDILRTTLPPLSPRLTSMLTAPKPRS